MYTAPPSTLFEAGIIGSKAIIFLLLIILSFVNAYTKFISEKPRYFLGETVLVGSLAAISILFVSLVRGVPGVQTANLTLIAGMVFMLFHLFMELSGFNQVAVDPSKASKKAKKQQAVFKSKPTLIILGIVGLIMLALSAVVRDTSVPIGQLVLEGLVFSFLNAVPVIMISRDRGEKKNVKILKDFAIMMGMFFGLHLVLQFGGFYSGIFNE
jgi:hypothetical protein